MNISHLRSETLHPRLRNSRFNIASPSFLSMPWKKNLVAEL
jgi:hypothetical protein